MQIFPETQAKKTTAATATEEAIDAAVILSSGPARTVRPTPGAGLPGLVEGRQGFSCKIGSIENYFFLQEYKLSKKLFEPQVCAAPF